MQFPRERRKEGGKRERRAGRQGTQCKSLHQQQHQQQQQSLTRVKLCERMFQVFTWDPTCHILFNWIVRLCTASMCVIFHSFLCHLFTFALLLCVSFHLPGHSAINCIPWVTFKWLLLSPCCKRVKNSNDQREAGQMMQSAILGSHSHQI